MGDIVERLRNDVSLFSRLDWQEHVALAREAADEIERLRLSLTDAIAPYRTDMSPPRWVAVARAVLNGGR